MITPISSPEIYHYPVMMNEVNSICSPKNGGTYIDCTFGGGGYSKNFLKFENTKVIAFDRDRFILSISKKLQTKYPKRFFFYQKKFSKHSIKKFRKRIFFLFEILIRYVNGIIKNLRRGGCK